MRPAAFLITLVFMGAWELLLPRRPTTVFRPFRWFNNLALVAAGTALVWLVMPLLAVDAAKLAEARRWGLFNRIDLAPELEWALAFVLLDLAIFLQHAAFHFIPLLWRLHRVHHTDLDVDSSTGLRFHPLELLVSMMIKVAVITGLGAHWIAVLLFEIVLNAVTLFNHANVRAPWDGFLRLFIVTPDMHRVHHSLGAEDTDSNFGFNLPWWDRLFGTYKAETRQASLGLPQYRAGTKQTLPWLLTLPFRP
jgi:sterol desaturase/sphingolipid hydroxylase (fatty acid hydroxylase superfamily)